MSTFYMSTFHIVSIPTSDTGGVADGMTGREYPTDMWVSCELGVIRISSHSSAEYGASGSVTWSQLTGKNHTYPVTKL